MVEPDRRAAAVVVVNYGASALLESNLAPLTAAVPELTAVVVDNFSSAVERERIVQLAEIHGWLTVLADNAGFGAGMNVGVAAAAAAGARWYLLLNPDATLSPASLDALLVAVSSQPTALITPTIYRPDGNLWAAGSDLYLEDGRIRATRRRLAGAAVAPWLSGACLMVGAELWQRVGGFDPDYFLYWEDVDLSWRVREAGGSLQVCVAASAVHAEGGTQQRVSHRTVTQHRAGTAKSETYYYYNIRNRMLFATKHLSPRLVRRWLRLSAVVAWEVLRQGGRLQLLLSPGPVRAAVRGLRDARRLARRG